VLAPVTYWYRVGDGEWSRIEESAPGSGIYRVYASEDTNATYYFRALVGNQSGEDPIWTAYEGGTLPGSDGEPVSEAALPNYVKVQKTPPRDFTDADFVVYEHNGAPEAPGAVLSEALPDDNSEEGWYDRRLTVGVGLPRPLDASHAPMSTAYSLSLNGEEIQSGVSDIDDDRLFFQLEQDGVYAITVRTTDYAGNTNAEFTKTLRVDATAPELESIRVDTFENAAGDLLEWLSYGLFFRHVTVDIGVDYDVSGSTACTACITSLPRASPVRTACPSRRRRPGYRFTAAERRLPLRRISGA
jgi:hypothetical protein